MYWGASRDSRYSGARRGIGAPMGLGGYFEVSGGIRGVGVPMVYWELAGTLGTPRPEGV